MRPMMFRGKDRARGQWLHGSLIQEADGTCYIAQETESGGKVMVAEDSVGQRLERKDGNKQFIYEGDILEHPPTGERYQVIWDDYGLFLFLPLGEGRAMSYYEFEDKVGAGGAVVTGNVFENPEWIPALFL